VTEEAEAPTDDEADEAVVPKRLRWWQRPTVRTLRRQAVERDYTAPWDERENEESRLPESDAVHLVGLVLAEAFTPTTAANLYRVLATLSGRKWEDSPNRRERLERSRTAGGGGWENLGVLRRPGDFVLMDGMGATDPELPPDVSAVWLSLHYEMPSVAVLVATFTIEDDAGDLSAVMRRDHQTYYYDPRIKVSGHFGHVRAKVPWSRPARYRISTKGSHPVDGKRRECEALMSQHEDACLSWFVSRFPGSFAEAERKHRPSMRLLVTQEAVPFQDRRTPLESVGLDWNPDLWHSPEPDFGWSLSLDRWVDRSSQHRFRATLGGRRCDAAREQNGETGESGWYLTQRVSSDQSALMSRYALHALLTLYADRLAVLRDTAGTKRRFRRPVREARALDDYLSRDGLDVATITADVRVRTEDAEYFAWDVPTYVADRTHRPPLSAGEEPLTFAEGVRRRLREQADRLELDTEATTKNIRASAELRQAIANTRLQRVVLALSALALLVAVISLLVAVGAT
jgi:hypothetical protein